MFSFQAVFLDDNCIFDGCQRRPMQCGKRNVNGVDDSELNVSEQFIDNGF